VLVLSKNDVEPLPTILTLFRHFHILTYQVLNKTLTVLGL